MAGLSDAVVKSNRGLGSGDDLLVQCGRCNQGVILQRNSGNNQIICPECGE